MVCHREHIVGNYNGLEALFTFDHSNNNIKLAQIISSVMLLLFAVHTYVHRPHKDRAISLYRKYLIIYMINTSFFAFVRAVWDAGRLLFFTAALHNLGEWLIWWVLVHKPETVHGRSFYSNAWIWFIVIMVFTLDFWSAALFEQATGAACDAFMAMTFIGRRYLDGEITKTQQEAFDWGIFATITHFGTIGGLVALIFQFMPLSLNPFFEALSLISVYFSFGGHLKVVEAWDRSIDEYEQQKYQKVKTLEGTTSIEKDFRWPVLVRLLVVSFVIAFLGISLLNSIPQCGEDAEKLVQGQKNYI